MKTIHLIRHAKSSWDDSRLSDMQRPLAQRGIKDCKTMAQHLIEAGWNHRNIYCSQAKRAQMTIAGLAKELTRLKIDWHIDPELYTFSAGVLLDWLTELSDECQAITLVGHNPAFTDLINHLSGARLDNLPTCGYAQLSAEINSWIQVKQTEFQLKHLLKPKMFRDSI
jgi:Phosphohistidine phosphatase SixA